MSNHTKLPHYLWPKGRSLTEPNLMPNVNDSDGNTILFTDPRRKTTQATVIDLGDSPNSNNGDPLRTAFAKINNFMEATYWWDEGINQKFRDIDSELTQGFFIYTDSDERYNISLLENSNLRLNGKENQIEISVASQRTSNVGEDFDSEVWITFQFPETVDISTLRVSENASFDSDVSIFGNLTVGDDVRIDGKVFIRESLTVDSDVSFGGNLDIDGDINTLGKVHIKEGLIIDSDLHVKGSARIDSELYVKGTSIFEQTVQINDGLNVTGSVRFDSDVEIIGIISAPSFRSTAPTGLQFEDKAVFKGAVQFDSDVTANQQLRVIQEAYFEDDAFFFDNAYFDSDVYIRGSLTINGTTTALHSQNTQVRDSTIVLNYGQITPTNDIGIIFSRYDSDSVSKANYNTILMWDEVNDRFLFGETRNSGVDINPRIDEGYMYIGDSIEFFDSENNTRMAWSKKNARLAIYNRDGTETFAFDADAGRMEGNGTIDGGLF